MVVFELIDCTDQTLKYEYYPEDDRSNTPGIIILDRMSESVEVTVVAEKDFKKTISVEKLNSMRDSINSMRLEQGKSPLTEDELPTATASSSWYTYASHAIRKIVESYNTGVILRKGMSAWY